ncbi:hypothetical protein [Nesterenkonia halotolerans]
MRNKQIVAGILGVVVLLNTGCVSPGTNGTFKPTPESSETLLPGGLTQDSYDRHLQWIRGHEYAPQGTTLADARLVLQQSYDYEATAPMGICDGVSMTDPDSAYEQLLLDSATREGYQLDQVYAENAGADTFQPGEDYLFVQVAYALFVDCPEETPEYHKWVEDTFLTSSETAPEDDEGRTSTPSTDSDPVEAELTEDPEAWLMEHELAPPGFDQRDARGIVRFWDGEGPTDILDMDMEALEGLCTMPSTVDDEALKKDLYQLIADELEVINGDLSKFSLVYLYASQCPENLPSYEDWLDDAL